MKNTFATIIIFVLLIGIGGSLIPFLSIQFAPTKTSKYLTISYKWKGALAEIVEKEVTSNIEGIAATLRNVKKITSTSSKGKGSILIEFDKKAAIKLAKFELNSLIRSSQKNFPNNVTLPLVTEGKSRGRSQEITPVLYYTIIGDSDLNTIQKVTEGLFTTPITTIAGVASVQFYGATPFEWELRYDEKKLATYDIKKSSIETAIREYVTDKELGVGFENIGNDQMSQQFIEYRGRKEQEINWNSIPIKKHNNRIIHLGDLLVTANYQEQEKSRYTRVDGLNIANMTVYAEDDVNQIQLSRTVQKTIQQLKKRLPDGFSLLKVRDTTENLAKEIDSIIIRIISSLVIILLFVFVIHREWRYLGIIIASLIANIGIAFIFYYIFKIEIHLYSLAGITVSFGILIDNSILMLDHLRYKKNRKVFLAILAATLTTIGALSIIFFLEENLKRNLIDFALVLVINLVVSLAVSLFLIPSLLDKFPLKERVGVLFFKRKRRIQAFSKRYHSTILFLIRFKKSFVTLIILAFGIPVFLLPTTLDSETSYAALYNKTIGSELYEEIRPIVNKIFGGTLRLFTEADFVQLEDDDKGRTELSLKISMPDGATIGQTNIVAKKVENYLSQFEEVENYFTNLYNVENARITILFQPEFDKAGFPEFLKEELISLSATIGGCDISVKGVGQGFSNKMNESMRSSRIVLTGYNYETMLIHARKAKETLLKNPRIETVIINTGRRRYGNKPRSEYVMALDKQILAKNNTSVASIFQGLDLMTSNDKTTASIIYDGAYTPVKLRSSMANTTDVWEIKNSLNQQSKLKDIGAIVKERSSGEIKKVNQEFKVSVEYDFIGSYQLGEHIMESTAEELNRNLPMGYNATSEKFKRWNPKKDSQYELILLIILVIYFICAILLESLVQPIAVILMIPISFIGIFLTFYLFEIKFDQGGYASFLLLCGLVVNASLYIINDYNNFRIKDNTAKIKRYVKAYNAKIIPIFLTIISTILGLIPFLFSEEKGFWFSLATGTIGGLILSIPVLIFFLPVFLFWRHGSKRRLIKQENYIVHSQIHKTQ